MNKLQKQVKSFLAATAILVLTVTASGVTNDIVDRVYEGTTAKKALATAKQEIFDEAVREVSAELIKGIIGEAKYEKNKAVITAKILRFSGKYIPYMKAGTLQEEPTQIKMSVEMKISLGNLQQLLKENGLLYELEGSPVVLPLIAFDDRVHSISFRWWQDDGQRNNEKLFVIEQTRRLHQVLRETFWRNGFYTLSVLSGQLAVMAPEWARQENLRAEEMAALAENFSAQIVVRGLVSFEKNSKNSDGFGISVKLVAFQTSNGRVIGEVSRSVDSSPGKFEGIEKTWRKLTDDLANDLVVQVQDAWQRGTFGATLLKLSVMGRVPYADAQRFKDTLTRDLTQIKSMRERFFSSEKTSFELDVSQGAQELANRLEGFALGEQKIKVLEVSPQELKVKLVGGPEPR